MKLVALLLAISFSGYAQDNNSVVISPATNAKLDSTSSHVYCATTDIMWNELYQYLGELPMTSTENAFIASLNESVAVNYHAPIEDKYTVAIAGMVKDSVIEKINADLNRKFDTHWNPEFFVTDNALIAYSHLKKDVRFRRKLDDKFRKRPFNNSTVVDYFGADVGDANQSSRNILVNDYKDKDNFIVQLKCSDSLDEIYLAKIPYESTLQETYEAVIDRLRLNNVEKFDGGDILMIPYLKFDTTVRYTGLEKISLTNEAVKGKQLDVSQRISFDLNPQGIKLESLSTTIIDFADFDNPEPPRVLAFNQPFLIVMKRNGYDQPYFMYWVSDVSFMRAYSYVVHPREIRTEEQLIVGEWEMTGSINKKDELYKLSNKASMVFKSDGTFEKVKDGFTIGTGGWKYENNTIILTWSETRDGNAMVWTVDEISDQKFVVTRNAQSALVFEKK